ASASVAADGSFSLDVPAGHWTLTGAGAVANVEVGCGRVSPVSLIAEAAARRSAVAPEKPLRHADPPPSDTIRILVMPVPNANVNQSEVVQIADYVAAQIRSNYPDVFANTVAALAQALGFGKLQMQVGVEEPLDAGKALAAHFIVNLEIKRKTPNGFYLRLVM